jgi:hypothetical protein
VIKNEKQYRITKAQVRRFQDAIAELAGQTRPSTISPRLWEAQRQAALSQMEELREQVEAYERLNAGRSKQVQRYEATEYESASFARILKVVQALGLSMPKAVRLVRNG